MNLQESLKALAFVMFVVLVAIGFGLGTQLLARPDFFWRCALSRRRITKELLLSSKKEDSDFLVIYIGARVFMLFACLLALFWFFR